MLERTKHLKTTLSNNTKDLIKTETSIKHNSPSFEPRTPLRKIAIYAKPKDHQNVYKTIDMVVSDSFLKNKDEPTQTLYHFL